MGHTDRETEKIFIEQRDREKWGIGTERQKEKRHSSKEPEETERQTERPTEIPRETKREPIYREQKGRQRDRDIIH